MTLAYFDCFAGAGGDMIVASLLDAGLDLDRLTAELNKLDIGPFEVTAEIVQRNGMAGTYFNVIPGSDDQPHRHVADIQAIIRKADLPGESAARAEAVLMALGQAEAAVHGTSIDEVHFHEVGAVDSIVDIVGACVALELMGIDRVICSAIRTGSGTVDCDHGRLPVPTPATCKLIAAAKAPTASADVNGEATTPTAAALLTTLAESFGPMPEMTVSAVGCGAGTRTGGNLPNLLRVFVGESSQDGSADTVMELSVNLDDCTGEIIGTTIQALLAGGALDAWASPITTKKSRPGWMLSALCHPSDTGAVEAILLTETTSFGVRRRLCGRTKLDRRHETVQTPYGPVRVKVGSRDGRTLTAAPEFEDCRAAADAHHVPVKEVLAAAAEAYRGGASQTN
jgi:pyridinium-3,5-bisthiocarboxylic acid mononucleotide nickel chelatase